MRGAFWIGISGAAVLALGGCLNMPTPTNQITGTYVSGTNYQEFDCSRLIVERDSLERRETKLVAAQEQRIKNSQVQAVWLGIGQGDSIEASELAEVRGEKEAVIKTMAAKSCSAQSVSDPGE